MVWVRIPVGAFLFSASFLYAESINSNMKKRGIAILAVIMIFLIGCQEPVVCEKPYIKVANECCLDTNDNQLCDRVEETRTFSGQEEKAINEETKKADGIQSDL